MNHRLPSCQQPQALANDTRPTTWLDQYTYREKALLSALAARLLDPVPQRVGRGRSPKRAQVETEVLEVANLVVFHFARPDTAICVDDSTEGARRTPATGAVTVRDLHKNTILYDNQNFTFRDSFEFSNDPRSFFNEEDPAVERMSRAFGESVVSAIVNGLGVKEEKK